MDQDQMNGMVDQAKGKATETVGKVTGDKQKQVQGQLDQAKGAVERKVGEVKDATR
jgi:uncharacterized protein YjbJ (UPF0337 family)